MSLGDRLKSFRVIFWAPSPSNQQIHFAIFSWDKWPIHSNRWCQSGLHHHYEQDKHFREQMIGWDWHIIVAIMGILVSTAHMLVSVAWGTWLRRAWHEAARARQTNHFITSPMQSALFVHTYAVRWMPVAKTNKAKREIAWIINYFIDVDSTVYEKHMWSIE